MSTVEDLAKQLAQNKQQAEQAEKVESEKKQVFDSASLSSIAEMTVGFDNMFGPSIVLVQNELNEIVYVK